jgi:hypothetical protein
VKLFFNCCKVALVAALLALIAMQGVVYAAQTKSGVPQGPALDLSIKYYDRAMTVEGVLRETHFEETMLRRPGHVWVSRVLPKLATAENGKHAHQEHEASHDHKHFDPVFLPRHVSMEGDILKLNYVDRSKKIVINIVASEFENVNFDGSWINAYFLVDPQQVLAMPLSKKTSPVAGTNWHEQEKNGVFQRVLWDNKNAIPLEIETGRNDGSLLRRVSVKIEPSLSVDLPWSNLTRFIQKEYSDFLD